MDEKIYSHAQMHLDEEVLLFIAEFSLLFRSDGWVFYLRIRLSQLSIKDKVEVKAELCNHHLYKVNMTIFIICLISSIF